MLAPNDHQTTTNHIMFDLHNERCEAKKWDLLFVCVLVQREGERESEREKEKERERGRGV